MHDRKEKRCMIERKKKHDRKEKKHDRREKRSMIERKKKHDRKEKSMIETKKEA